MKMTALILEELEREHELTRRILERVPGGKNDWKPHPKAMPMGQLAHMVATMTSWIAMIVKQDELDIKPKAGAGNGAARTLDSSEMVKAVDQAFDEAREAVSDTTDKHLETPWSLLEGGKVVVQKARYSFILENFKHLAHHRGQLSVYLRLNGALVPAIYGPSADEHRF